MKVPDKVWLNKLMIRHGMLLPAQFPTDESEFEYIRKDSLLEWAKTKLSHLQEDFDVYTGQRLILRELIEKINAI